MDDHRPPTPRQLEILALVAQGNEIKDAASLLVISPVTARNHVTQMHERLGSHSLVQALAICVTHGYLGVDGRARRIYVPAPFDADVLL